jgi:anionic cell wall polymer biosynthesis LytR-Cps2A-Psr (LCP) family protein
VGQLVGEPVERYLRVDLDAVAKVANALGGVEVDVPKRMYYVDNAQGLHIDLYPGRQVLRGDDLLGFLRFRHDEMGDLGRMERQRLVINQVFTRLVQPATLTQLPALLKIAGEDISTDLTPIEMTQLVTAMARTKLSTTRLPGRLYWQDDLSYWMPDSNTAHPTGSGEEPAP